MVPPHFAAVPGDSRSLFARSRGRTVGAYWVSELAVFPALGRVFTGLCMPPFPLSATLWASGQSATWLRRRFAQTINKSLTDEHSLVSHEMQYRCGSYK